MNPTKTLVLILFFLLENYLLPYVMVAQKLNCGYLYSHVICADKTVQSWGDNAYGELGIGSFTTTMAPAAVNGLTGITSVSSFDEQTLFVKNDGTVWACGKNQNGELGDNNTTPRNIPFQIIGLSGIIDARCGGAHSIFLKNDGTVWGCGKNDLGQLGDNNPNPHITPGQITSLSGITAIACGQYHSMFRKSDGTVWACGDNTSGQLGNGTTISSSVPVQANIPTGVYSLISAGAENSFFLNSNGTVWACGNNSNGQCGDGTTVNIYSPAQINSLSGISALFTGWSHTFFLKNDGTVLACGGNFSGKLGIGTTTQQNSPVQVNSLTGIVEAAGGHTHSLFLKNDGTIWGCGYNVYGQVGDGTNVARLTPVLVSGPCPMLPVIENEPPVCCDNKWDINGNVFAGTNVPYFLGTVSSHPLVFKVASEKAGRIDHILFNTSIGYQTLNINTTGINNSAHGYQSLFVNKTGINNSAMGSSALIANNGNNNTAMGFRALFQNGKGDMNTGIGVGALKTNTTGISNTALGYEANVSLPTLINATAIGANAIATLNNTIQLGDPAVVNVKTFGTYTAGLVTYPKTLGSPGQVLTLPSAGGVLVWTTPVGGVTSVTGIAPISMTGTSSAPIITITQNTASNGGFVPMGGTNANYVWKTDASGNPAWRPDATGAGSGWGLTGNTGTVDGINFIGNIDNIPLNFRINNQKAGRIDQRNTFLGYRSFLTSSFSNVTMLGSNIANALCTGDNQVLLGNVAVSQIRAAVTGITSYSDVRYKTNIKEIAGCLDFILKLKPVTYNVMPNELYKIWGIPDSMINKMDFKQTEKETHIGFIAQDVEKAAKESGFNFPGIDIPANTKEVYTLRYVDFIMPMVKGMQELAEENKLLKAKMLKQENDLILIQKEIEKLQSKILEDKKK